MVHSYSHIILVVLAGLVYFKGIFIIADMIYKSKIRYYRNIKFRRRNKIDYCIIENTIIAISVFVVNVILFINIGLFLDAVFI